MLFVLIPVSYILATISMLVNTKSLRHIVDELTLIKVTRCMVQFTPTVVQVIFPKAFVYGAIRPSHYAVALFDVWGVFQHLS